MKNVERISKDLAAFEAEFKRASGERHAAREKLIRALADGVGVEEARKGDAAARAAEEDAKATVDASREALARVRREEQEAARAADVAELTADARRLAREADELIRSGVAKIAAGSVDIGRACLAAAESEDADSALGSLNAPPAGRGRVMNTELQDAINEAVHRAYTAVDRGSVWTEALKIDLLPLRCAAK